MAKKKKKKKSKSLFKKTGNYIINIAVFLMTLWFAIPLGIIANGFYSGLFNSSPQKTRTYSKKVRTYHASYQDGKYHY